MKLSHALLLPYGPEAYAELRAMYAAGGANPALVTGSTVEARALVMAHEHEMALAAMPALPGDAPERVRATAQSETPRVRIGASYQRRAMKGHQGDE